MVDCRGVRSDRKHNAIGALLAGAALFAPGIAIAQSGPSPDAAAAPVGQPVSPAGSKRTYSPADFARFAPNTAYDMLAQVPGFTIKSADQERGLGQASENILINGDRIANKSGGAIDELRKVPAANVERIEIVDASALGLAGLTGQVANVIVKAGSGSGQFEWKPNFRAHYAAPNLYQGSISYSGKTGPINYTFSVEDQVGRGGFGGPVYITDANGALIERRLEEFHAESDLVTIKGKFAFRGPASGKGNLTLSITPYWAPDYDSERRERADRANRTRVTSSKLNGWYYDISGDYDFKLGPGRLKLIGVRHFDHEPVVTTQFNRFDSGVPDTGIRLGRKSGIGETVLRGEYGWKTGKNSWQLSFERAFNSLDQRGTLFTLSPGGSFDPVAFPGGSGKVQETRYESTATFTRPLGKALDLQVVLGAETSSLDRVDGNLPPRRFFRPKGSLSLGWRPSAGWDASLKLRRRVGQISFYDFLSQPNLREDRANSGNPDLVPPQSWELESEIGRDLGRWGKTRLRFYAHRIDDIIDIIPIGIDGEGVGNIARASRFGMESTSTVNFDSVGFKGAKLDATFGFEKTRVRDPLTNAFRAISNTRDGWISLALRQDVPRSRFAWGVNAEYEHYGLTYYPTEVQNSWEGPWFVTAFVERKNVRGMTLGFKVINLFNARHFYDRDVYDGRRTVSPLLFREHHDQLIGPIFSFSIKGKF